MGVQVENIQEGRIGEKFGRDMNTEMCFKDFDILLQMEKPQLSLCKFVLRHW